jgi:2,4-dienoyl-CoA reductase (NADPH2)
VFDGEDLRALLTGEGSPEAARKLSLVGRLAVRAGRAVGVTSDPGKLREASKAYMPVGNRVVILGGGLVGCELAEFLHDRGRDVTVLEEGPDLATAMAHPRRWRVLYELREAGVELVTNARLLEISDQAVHYELPAASESEAPTRHQAPAETVIIATGLAANPEAIQPFEGLAPNVQAIGDCTGVSYLEGAIHEAFQAAKEL